MNELMGMIRSFGIGRLAAIIGVTIGVAVAMALVVTRMGEAPMTPLYADLDVKDSEALISRLDGEKVKYDIRESGGKLTVLVPHDQASALKIKLAGDGFIASSGNVGYEIFDGQDALGQTSFQQNISRLRALEGELARTISTIAGVRSARVHLVLPERELFSRDRQQATASIVVDAPAGLDRHSVRAIVNLAASAVPALTPAHVTVLDSTGNLLASGQDGDDAFAVGGGADERIAATENRIRRTVEDIVGKIVGPENIRVQVAADIDFSRITETSNIIDPDSQTVLSATTVEDQSNSNDPALTRGVTVGNQLPAAEIVDPQAYASATSTARRTEETTNYEMTRTVRNEVREMGGVKRLSVAVALNLQSRADANGVAAPAPRTEEELARITALVRSAVGYNAARGDQVDVIEAPFQPVAQQGVAASAPTMAPVINPGLVLRVAEIAGLALIALALIVFVLRPMLSPARIAAPMVAPAREIASAQGPAALLPAAQPPGGLENLIDLAQVDGKVKASSLKRVAEVVKAHSDESASILKSWIRQAS